MKWNNLRAVLEEYNNYLDSATQTNLPNYYELKDNIKFILDINNNLFEISFRAPEYWKYVNYGRSPGTPPPITVIENWITKRRIVPRPLANGKLPSTKSLAFLISRKIGREGTEGLHFLEKSLDEQKDYWFNRIADAIGSDIESEISFLLSPLNGDTAL